MELHISPVVAGMPESDLDMHIMHQEGEFAPPSSPCEDPEEKSSSPALSDIGQVDWNV